MEQITLWFTNTWNLIVNWFQSGAWQIWFSENVYPIIIAVCGAVVAGILSKGVNNVSKWLKSRVKSDKASELITKLDTIITECTNATSQYFVSNLKKEKKFNLQKQEEAMKTTLTNIQDRLSNELKSFIKENYGNIEDWLKIKVESVLHKEK